MPMHDWTRLKAFAYHDFHTAWLVSIRRTLNGGLLPAGFYARAEQTTRTMGPDILTLQVAPPVGGGPPSVGNPAAARRTVKAAPPRVRLSDLVPARPPSFRQKHLTIRHASNDRLVALIELVSPGNKAAKSPFHSFVGKVTRAVEAGIHVLVIDPFPPGKRDPNGIQGAVWEELGGNPYTQPADKPLTCASYEAGDAAGSPHRCYVEPFAVGDPVPEMPLFLEPEEYVNVPLEATYQATWPDVVPQDRAILEAP